MLSWIYEAISKIRNVSYDKQIFKSYKVERPVVSIGNITVGGTGKTPVVDHILKWSQKVQIPVGVVSRGYGGNYEGIKKVPSDADPHIYGDEPSMLAFRNLNTPIYISKDRVAASRKLIKNELVKLIIADDAFQHRKLFRDLDILIVDLLEPIKNYGVLPFGRARESLKSMARANFVILNKANLVSPEQLNNVAIFLKPYCNKHCQFISGEYKAGKIIPIFGERTYSTPDFLLVCGIGRPSSFAALAKLNNLNVVQNIVYKDHHKYSLSDIKKIQEQAKSFKVKNILCTQKDAVKLKNLIKNPTPLNWFYLDMSVELIGAEKLYDKIRSLCI